MVLVALGLCRVFVLSGMFYLLFEEDDSYGKIKVTPRTENG